MRGATDRSHDTPSNVIQTPHLDDASLCVRANLPPGSARIRLVHNTAGSASLRLAHITPDTRSSVTSNLKHPVQGSRLRRGGFQTHPCATHPCATHPCATHPCATHPCATHPCATHPCATHPCATHPCATRPYATRPCATRPCATRPCATRPCATRPCATRPYPATRTIQVVPTDHCRRKITVHRTSDSRQ
ncbi:MAG: hypothetical protein KatS3mg054_0967 [Chloroflexus sp.]|nr:MAG: hypothetical protein KatS3mg054_0967 [Chloroflexus sp.]